MVPTLTLPGGPLIRTLTGHEDFVDAIVIFDEGRRAISVSHDQTARVWDLDRGTEIMKLSGERDGVTAVAVTSGGERAVIVSSNYTFEVWDLKEGKKLRTFDGHRAEIHALIITPDNRFVISGGADSTIKIWDLESGTLAGSLEGHSNNVAALAITPDGQTLLSGSWDGKIGLWDLADRKLLRFLPAHEKWIIGLLCDSEYVVSASGDNTVKIWNIATGEQLSMLTGFHFYSSATRPMALCPSGSCLVLGGSDGEIAIWDLGKGSAWLLEEGHTAWVCAVDVFPDNQRAISASGDKTIKIWNLHATRRDQRPAHEYFVTKLIVKPDGKEAVSASPRDGLKVWDLRTLELIKSIPIPPPDGGHFRMRAQYGMSMQAGDFLAMAFFPDGRRCAWALQDESVRVTDLDGRELCASTNPVSRRWQSRPTADMSSARHRMRAIPRSEPFGSSVNTQSASGSGKRIRWCPQSPRAANQMCSWSRRTAKSCW